MTTSVKDAVVKRYASAAKEKESELCCPTGYKIDELQKYIPQEVLDISYGCGTPAGLDYVKPGETVLDIGSGGGIDCFEALRKVGAEGTVIGVDMTDEMLEISRRNAPIVAKNLNIENPRIEFKKGEAENLPLADDSVDLIISNCVINLSPDKEKVFQEMHRVLRPGGRFTISDIVCDSYLPQYLIRDSEKWGACLTGALFFEDYLSLINQAGFLGVTHEKSYPWKHVDGHHFYSITITAYKLPALEEKDAKKWGYAVLVGPCARAVDELSNLYVRGKAKQIDGKTLQMLEIPAYKPYFEISEAPFNGKMIETFELPPEQIGCVFSGDFAVYGGPFLEIDDDDQHTYNRGGPQEICGRTRKVILNSKYNHSFAIINKATTPVSSSCDDSSCC